MSFTRARTFFFGALLAFGILGIALVATRQPLGGGDYVAIWGLKARALSRSHSLSALFRIDPAGLSSHPEYPPLWPLTLATFSAVTERYDDLVVSLPWPLLALGASLLAMRVTRGERNDQLLAGAAIALLPYYRTPMYVGYAEALLVVLLLAAFAETDRLAQPWATPRLALFLCLAALTKIEGILAAVVFVVILTAARRIRTAAIVTTTVALVGVLPMALYRRSQSLPEGPRDFSAASFRLENLSVATRALMTDAVLPNVPWLLGAAVLLMLAPATCGRRRPVLAGVVLYVGGLFASFAFSRRDPAWHVHWTWDRLALVPIVFLIPVFVEAAAEAIAARTAPIEPDSAGSA